MLLSNIASTVFGYFSFLIICSHEQNEDMCHWEKHHSKPWKPTHPKQNVTKQNHTYTELFLYIF